LVIQKKILDLDFKTKKIKFMKNIFAVIVLFFAFTNIVSAQETEKKDPYVFAKNELNALLKVVELDHQIEIALNNLLIYKHETLLKYPEQKSELAKTMEGKLKGTLTPEQFSKVKKDKVLFNDLLY
jgi:hypothetical protein